MSVEIDAPKRKGAKKDFVVSAVIGAILTAVSYGIGLHFGWESHLNWLEVFSVFTSYSCTWLCTVERRANYWIGAISTAALCVLFWHQGLVASSLQNAYLTPWLIYGWIRWRKDEVTRPVTFVKWYWWPVYIAVAALTWLGAIQIVHAFGGTMALIDSFVLVGSIGAQILLDNKKWENWLVWLIVDIVAVYDYWHAGLHLVAFQFIFFIVNAVVAMFKWNRSRKERNVEQSIRTNDSIAPDQGALALNPVRI